jgi:hypothetical protein
MTKSASRHHRHHKNHRVRRALRAHGHGGTIRGNTGLHLPLFTFSPIPGVPHVTYPQGWTFKPRSPDQNAVLYVGAGLVLLGLALALLRLLAG